MKRSMEPIIDQDSRILILGTMPGEKSLEKNEYYGNPGNHFWKIIYSIFDSAFETDFNTRKKFILSKNLALWDVLDSCMREGSLDSKIREEVPNDFDSFFERHPTVKVVVFASKMAEKYFDRFARRPQQITFLTLPSPSGANASVPLAEKIQRWRIITKL